MNRSETSVSCPASIHVFTQRWWFVAALLVVSLAGACSRPTPVALLFNPAPWRDGETHIFHVTDVDGKLPAKPPFMLWPAPTMLMRKCGR
ncbi:MAG: hypothetical protein IPM07_03430 [Anaerolineales bacterium]|nr:hypothetical protein [Anaerolineales bacterium]